MERAASGGPSRRTRKVATALAVVDHDERARAKKARLNALEDDQAQDELSDIEDDDEEFVLDSDDDDSEDSDADGTDKAKDKPKKKKPKAKKRKRKKVVSVRTSRHRGSLSGGQKLKSLGDWIEQDGLEEYPDYEPTYLTAVVGPARTRSGRKYCSVCGQLSRYCCVRCGSRYCCLRCSTIHNETRCLKFTA
jgi:zinc finger HIT domain-containing protein 1